MVERKPDPEQYTQEGMDDLLVALCPSSSSGKHSKKDSEDNICPKCDMVIALGNGFVAMVVVCGVQV